MTLDPDDARPPYAQVADALRREIEGGRTPAGSRLETHQQLASKFGVSIGTVKRALGELQGAGLVVSRQGQGTYVRTRRSVLQAIPPSFSAEILEGLWITSYQFKSGTGHIKHHADISYVTAQSNRRLTARNYPPDPRTQTTLPVFRNDIEAHLVNRHVIGHWRNVGDMRYFGSIHLAVRPGEEVMEGYYTGFSSDIEVDAMRWKWVRLEPVDLPPVELAHVKLKEPEMIYERVQQSDSPLILASLTEAT